MLRWPRARVILNGTPRSLAAPAALMLNSQKVLRDLLAQYRRHKTLFYSNPPPPHPSARKRFYGNLRSQASSASLEIAPWPAADHEALCLRGVTWPLWVGVPAGLGPAVKLIPRPRL